MNHYSSGSMIREVLKITLETQVTQYTIYTLLCHPKIATAHRCYTLWLEKFGVIVFSCTLPEKHQEYKWTYAFCEIQLNEYF